MAQDHPLPYIQQYRQQLSELRHQMRQDIQQIQEPQARAMMTTAAEVLKGLSQAFDDYQRQEEPAGKPGAPQIETHKPQDTGNQGPGSSSSPTHG
jgi:hypothetical protein